MRECHPRESHDPPFPAGDQHVGHYRRRNFYTFNVKYADEPLLLNVEMCDFIHDGESVNRPNNAMEIYLTELDNESPRWSG
mgnify:CR=1 FL=1